MPGGGLAFPLIEPGNHQFPPRSGLRTVTDEKCRTVVRPKAKPPHHCPGDHLAAKTGSLYDIERASQVIDGVKPRHLDAYPDLLRR